MVLSDVNGNGKKSAAERWLRQRNGQRSTAARCIFGPPEKRSHMMALMRNEAEMDRKRAEFVARYEPVGLTASERRVFYDGLVKTSSSSPTSSQNRQLQYHQQNNDHARNAKAADHYRLHNHHNNYHHHHHHHHQQQQQKNNNGFKQPDDNKK